jgi:hypothetical protein
VGRFETHRDTVAVGSTNADSYLCTARSRRQPRACSKHTWSPPATTRPATAWSPGNASPKRPPTLVLGWARYQSGDAPAIDFYVRELWDGKLSAEVESMTPDVLRRYATTCASALALSHARSGDASMIDGYLGDDDTFDRAITKFAEAYADRTEQDYAELHTAAEDGRIPIVDDI